MPKKSNKTAHVLSLLTNGSGEPIENFPEPESKLGAKPEPEALKPESLKPEVIVEMQSSTQSDILSDLVKSDLEKELDNQLSKNKNCHTKDEASNIKAKDIIEKDELSDINERPPYSQTFIDKFGMNSSEEELKHVAKEDKDDKEDKEDKDLPVSLGQVKSEAYILENFDDEDEVEPEPIQILNDLKPNSTESSNSSVNSESTKILHNFAEDIIRSKAPVVMKSLNMCTCQDCINDVAALTLNHTKPLYTVTEKGKLFQKLTAYELQYGADLASQITKACIKVKLNPRHSKTNSK